MKASRIALGIVVVCLFVCQSLAGGFGGGRSYGGGGMRMVGRGVGMKKMKFGGGGGGCGGKQCGMKMPKHGGCGYGGGGGCGMKMKCGYGGHKKC